ncbi:DUF1648 domain-containing protein [Solibacillus sp. MA9]|uniref:DUF1648 domain-containing protein n=1 Tax=Solibacillus palustris TaxID=2908203 RepID=A0ABS9UAW4_9BACL|nr:DUF1648 domain-containing protein [Solibacillus sp. MA9]MCH7321486.1 DUF1648 domain-containing protein [Solibacillus sp. MA9]
MFNESTKPKLHIPKTKLEWGFDTVGYLALATMFVVLIVNWSDLPAQVPAHVGANGQVDRWGSKWELLILPVIGIGLHFFLFVLEKFPETHNYPANFNEKNAVAFYTNSRQTMNYTRNIINVLFTYSVIEVTSLALGHDSSLGLLFYMILGLLFIVLGYKIYKTFQIK